MILLALVSRPLPGQQREADEAWIQGRHEAARAGYQQVLARNPRDVLANLRLGVLLSWQGKLDSSLVFLSRARAGSPADPEIRVIQARVLAWKGQYDAAIVRYDSLLQENPRLRDAALGRARALAWAGRLEEAQSVFRRMLAADSADRDARLGQAQVSAWKGNLTAAEQDYRKLLARNSRDVEARVGLGYVYLWQGRADAAARQADYALAIDTTHKAAVGLRRDARETRASSVESSANWSHDSDGNTSFWQTLGATTPVSGGLAFFASANALETSDPVRDATRLGAEAGASWSRGGLQLTGAAGARRLSPEVAPVRTAATYRGRLAFRPTPSVGLGVGYSRLPFDEIAGLIERELDLESLEGGFDVKPTAGLMAYGGAGALWLSDGNRRTSFSAGLNQKIGRKLFVGAFGRTLSYESRVVGYFSPDRFSVLEAVAGYAHESRTWLASLSGGLGAQQVGEQGAAQTEWHLEGRVGPRWGAGNRVELFGLITNSAVSSTTGAFRYGSAGITARLAL
ncbi:MAG TPA: tetratricopeptide repeat protein [Gemmatimonadales bacterium]